MTSIRRATAADVDALVWLRLRLLDEMGDIPPGADSDALAAAIEQYFTDQLLAQRFHAWVAEDEGRIVGTGGLVFLERPPSHDNLAGLDAYIMNIYTRPERRGGGIATAILRAMVEHARAADACRIWLHASEAGAAIYAREGFTVKRDVMELTW
jgi:GNAT superfamily N-acetyltransferase